MDKVNDFPNKKSSRSDFQPLFIAKNQHFSSTAGVLQTDISVSKSLSLYELCCVTELVSRGRLTSSMTKYLLQPSNFLPNILTLTECLNEKANL